MKLVCKAWNAEISSTPWFWRQLLQRHDWPIPEVPTEPRNNNNSEGASEVAAAATERNMLYRTFVSHYLVVRNMKAIKRASHLLWKSPQDNEAPGRDVETEWVLKKHEYSKLDSSSCCTHLEVVGPNLVLSADGRGAVSFFLAVSGAGGGTVCRQVDLISSPRGVLAVLDFDDDVVVCSYKRLSYMSCRLIVLYRDDLKVNHNRSFIPQYEDVDKASRFDYNYNQHDFNIDEAIRCFVSRDTDDSSPVRRYQEKIHVAKQRSLIACRNGLVLLDVTMDMCRCQDVDEAAEIPEHVRCVMGRRLVVFSVLEGTVVWIRGNRATFEEFEYYQLSFTRMQRYPASRDRHPACHVVVSSPGSPALFLVLIKPTAPYDTVVTPLCNGRCFTPEGEDELEEWKRRILNRTVVATPTDVVVVDDRTSSPSFLVSFFAIGETGHTVELPDMMQLQGGGFMHSTFNVLEIIT